MAAPKNNKYAVGNKGGGREPLYKTPEEMQTKIDEYFTKEKVWTIPGLAYHLGFCDKKSLIDYEAKEVFLFSIKRAKLRIEDFNAKELHTKNGNVSGVIFTLKNMGWKDQQDIDLKTDLSNLSEGQLIFIANKLIKEQNEKYD